VLFKRLLQEERLTLEAATILRDRSSNMKPSPSSKTLTALSLVLLLVSCSTTRAPPRPSADEIENLVLIIQETSEGQVLHSWRHAEGFELSRPVRHARSREGTGRIVFAASSERDCHAEYLQCLKDCESNGLPPGFEHIEKFTAIDDALEWLKRNHRTLLVGSVVVIAGVVFVVVSAGAGAVVLAPALLLALPGIGIPVEPQLARALA
jgi:hypothetical protein